MSCTSVSAANGNPHAARAVKAFAILTGVSAVALAVLAVLISQGILLSQINVTTALMVGMPVVVMFALIGVAIKACTLLCGKDSCDSKDKYVPIKDPSNTSQPTTNLTTTTTTTSTAITGVTTTTTTGTTITTTTTNSVGVSGLHPTGNGNAGNAGTGGNGDTFTVTGGKPKNPLTI